MYKFKKKLNAPSSYRRSVKQIKSFKFNCNIIEKNIHNAYTRKTEGQAPLSETSRQKEQRLYYLNYVTGKYNEFVGQHDREKLHHFLSSPVLNLRPQSSPQQQPAVMTEYKEFKAVRTSFFKTFRPAESRLPSSEPGSTRRVTHVIEFKEKDRKLLESESNMYIPRIVVDKLSLKLNRNMYLVERLRMVKQLIHVKTSFIRANMCGKALQLTDLFPRAPLEHAYANSFFKLVQLSKRNFKSTKGLLLSFIQRSPELVFQRDLKGMTALSHFVEQRNLVMVRHLVRAGSLVFAGSPSPMRRCIRAGFKEGVVLILEEYAL